MDTISLLLPTRKRRSEFLRFVESVKKTASYPTLVEIVAYIDDDDNSYNDLPELRNVKFISGPRIVLSEMWNKCYSVAQGPIFGHMGDDIVFKTPNWDEIVRNEFFKFPDRIAFIHGNDGGREDTRDFGTHGFIHQNWVDTVGYFVPPYFSSDYNDTWLNDVANMIDRRRYVDILTDHLHFVFGKSPLDETYRDRLERHQRDNVDQLYRDYEPERQADAMKLKIFMDEYGFLK